MMGTNNSYILVRSFFPTICVARYQLSLDVCHILMAEMPDTFGCQVKLYSRKYPELWGAIFTTLLLSKNAAFFSWREIVCIYKYIVNIQSACWNFDLHPRLVKDKKKYFLQHFLLCRECLIFVCCMFVRGTWFGSTVTRVCEITFLHFLLALCVNMSFIFNIIQS